MKGIQFLILVMLMCLLGTQLSVASSLMGGSITYTCKGNGKYDVYVTAIIDCGGTGISPSNLIAKCSTATVTVSNQTKISTTDITGIDSNCPLGSRCSGSYQYGFEETIWKMELDLSAYGNSYCDWTLSWQQCCRSGAITTGSAGTGYYMHATLNKCLSACNSSPSYLLKPRQLLCHNQATVINLGAMDTIDTGDSLSYELINAQDSVGSVPYTGIFSPIRPFSFIGFPNQNLMWPAGFHLDPLSGDLLFTPTQVNQVAVVVVLTKEWRKINGTPTVIGQTMRELTVFVVQCNNSIVKILPPYSKQLCAGEKTCITIATDDDDSSDSTRISWSGVLPGATFTQNNGTVKHASGQLCWTPDSSMVSNIPYFTYITAQDNHCPLSSVSTRAISFFVRSMPEGVLHDTVIGCGKIALDHNITRTATGLQARYEIYDTSRTLRWQGSKKVDTAIVPPGRYYVQLILQSSTPCFKTYEDTVDIGNYIQVDLSADTIVCAGQSLTLQAGLCCGLSPYTYEWWDLTDSVSLNSGNNPETFTFNNDKQFALMVTDGNGCKHSDSMSIKTLPLPTPDLGPDQAFCEGDSILLDAGGDSLGWTYLWKDGNTSQTKYSREDRDVWVQVTDTMGCKNTDTMDVLLNEVNVLNAKDIAVCSGDLVDLQLTGADNFYWYDQAGYQGNGQDVPKFTGSQLNLKLYQDEYLFVEGRKAVLGTQCSDLDTIILEARELPKISLGGNQSVCVGDSLILSAPSGSGYTYLWNTGDSTQTIFAYQFGIYKVQLTDSFGCENNDSIQLSLVSVAVNAGPPQTVCVNDTMYLYAGGADSIRWYDADNFIPGNSNIAFHVGNSFRYLAISDKRWIVEGIRISQNATCSGYDSVDARVYPHLFSPIIQGSRNPDTLFSYSYVFDTTGQKTITWSIDNGKIIRGQGTASVEVMWSEIGQGLLKVVGISLDGCYNEASLQVNIQATSFRVPKKAGFKVYPNPVRDWLFISFEDGTESGFYVISNALGQEVMKGAIQSSETKINLELLPSGVYLLQIEGKGAVRIVVE